MTGTEATSSSLLCNAATAAGGLELDESSISSPSSSKKPSSTPSATAEPVAVPSVAMRMVVISPSAVAVSPSPQEVNASAPARPAKTMLFLKCAFMVVSIQDVCDLNLIVAHVSGAFQLLKRT